MSCNRSDTHDAKGVEALLSHGIRVSDQGAFFSVAVSESAIDEWCERWPASGLRGLRGVRFQFDKGNGDLVDIDYRNGTSDDWDGPALAALSQDAQEAGQRRLKKGRENKAGASDPFIAAHEPAFREMGLSVKHTKGCITVCKDKGNRAGDVYQMSLLSIDVGFDLRMNDILVKLPPGHAGYRVLYHPRGSFAEKTVEGNYDKVASTLRKAGYKVKR